MKLLQFQISVKNVYILLKTFHFDTTIFDQHPFISLQMVGIPILQLFGRNTISKRHFSLIIIRKLTSFFQHIPEPAETTKIWMCSSVYEYIVWDKTWSLLKEGAKKWVCSCTPGSAGPALKAYYVLSK